MEALPAGIDERGQAADFYRSHEIGEVHEKARGLEVEAFAKELALKAALNTARGLWIQDQSVGEGLDSEIDCGRLEGIAVVGK